MTGDDFKAARRMLGYNTHQMARALKLGRHGHRVVERIEAGATITGPMSLAVQKLLNDAKVG